MLTINLSEIEARTLLNLIKANKLFPDGKNSKTQEELMGLEEKFEGEIEQKVLHNLRRNVEKCNIAIKNAKDISEKNIKSAEAERDLARERVEYYRELYNFHDNIVKTFEEKRDEKLNRLYADLKNAEIALETAIDNN